MIKCLITLTSLERYFELDFMLVGELDGKKASLRDDFPRLGETSIRGAN